jgi:hypothetical protein
MHRQTSMTKGASCKRRGKVHEKDTKPYNVGIDIGLDDNPYKLYCDSQNKIL